MTASKISRALPPGWPTGRDFGGGSRAVRDPFTGEVIAQVHWARAVDVASAVASARQHLPALPGVERAGILERAAGLLRERQEDFARVITMEAGKPITQARGEVARCIDTIIFSAIEARTATGEMVPMDGTTTGGGKLGIVVRSPIGVVGAIAPFNFPLNLVAHKVAPAIAAGCPVVLKPAPQTPLSAIALAALLEEAGLPAGALHVLPGDAAVGSAIVDHPDVPLISFTGSDRVGRAIQRQVPHKTVLLELGNATPVIVAADADLPDAARRVARSGFTHAGQSCVSVQRVYVQRTAYRAFLEMLIDEVATLVAGDPLDDRTDVGPVIDAHSTERVLEVIAEAERAGGIIATGGTCADGIIAPTIVADLPPECRLANEEAFGPVVGVAPIDDLADGVRLANATPLGLQAGIFTSRVDVALALARDLDFGGVVINETPTFRTDQMPYGGVKESGNTREGPRYAVQAMTVPKLLIVRLPG